MSPIRTFCLEVVDMPSMSSKSGSAMTARIAHYQLNQVNDLVWAVRVELEQKLGLSAKDVLADVTVLSDVTERHILRNMRLMCAMAEKDPTSLMASLRIKYRDVVYGTLIAYFCRSADMTGMAYSHEESVMETFMTFNAVED